MHPISDKLIIWFKKNKRDLPWRNTSDAYKIWLSEIMLQQTQVAQGLSYYLKFTETFPTVVDLANAPEDQVMRLWQGLGYYSRARNLHAAAKAAIASFAFDLPYAVVDGNVYRVLSRLFNLNTPINSSQGKKEFQLLADELLNKKKAALHNNAIMELGALCCKPQNPLCETCPLQSNCMAYANKTVSLLPVKTGKTKIKNRYFNYIVFNYKNATYISKRTKKDIWQNLYEFFLVETDAPVNAETLFEHPELVELNHTFTITKITEAKKHILSHQHLHSVFYEINLSVPLKMKDFIEVNKALLSNYGFPQLINKYLEK